MYDFIKIRPAFTMDGAHYVVLIDYPAFAEYVANQDTSQFENITVHFPESNHHIKSKKTNK